jgi:hypothetical protein
MNAPGWQLWGWVAAALLCSVAVVWVNPCRGVFLEGVRLLGRQVWLLWVPAMMAVGDLLRGGGCFGQDAPGMVVEGAAEQGSKALCWLVLSDWPALLLVVGLVVGFPGFREGWRAGVDEFSPGARRVFHGLAAAGVAALIWLAWTGVSDGEWTGKAVVLLGVPLVATGMAVMVERWRIGLASAVPVGWTDGWRQSVYLGLRDRVRLVVSVAVTGLAVFLPEPWRVVALGIGAVALAAGRWREQRAGRAAVLAWICVAAAWILTLEVLLVLVVKSLPPPLAVVAVVLRAGLVTVLFAALFQAGEAGRSGQPKTLRLRAGRGSGKPGRGRSSGRMRPPGR